jgi:hypothetical protein
VIFTLILVCLATTFGTVAVIQRLQRAEIDPERRAAQGRWLTIAGLVLVCAAAMVGKIPEPGALVRFLLALLMILGSAVFFVGCAQLERAKLDQSDPRKR